MRKLEVPLEVLVKMGSMEDRVSKLNNLLIDSGFDLSKPIEVVHPVGKDFYIYKQNVELGD